MKTFTVQYGEHTISVTNSTFHEHLWVDGRLQDHGFGFGARSLLWGHVEGPDGLPRTVKVRIGGVVIMTCDIFVGDEQVMSAGRPVAPGSP